MGGLFSKPTQEYQIINSDLNRLIKDQVFTLIDQNNDNIITRDEFDSWNYEMRENINKIKNKNKEIITQFEKSIADKNKEINELKNYIQTLEQTTEELQKSNNKLSNQSDYKTEEIKSIINKVKVRQYVKKILKDEQININGMPDRIEQSIYTNIIYIIMQMISDITQDSQLKFINHNFRVVIN